MKCRHCNHLLQHQFLDLGFAPPSNAYLSQADLTRPELYYPLKLYVCERCWLVQTEDYAAADSLFASDYAYFSSTSSGCVQHAKQYSEKIIEILSLTKNSFVIEVASNDGYLLKNFVEQDIPCLGIEPTDSTADAAEKLNIPVLRDFFGETLAKKLVSSGKQADLIIGNNVYAHVPDINDFTRGLKALLKASGTITLEFPHLLQLIKHCQFDTVYHEHFSYLSLFTVSLIFEKAGLRIFDVEELPTHGGSLRIYACHQEHKRPVSQIVADILKQEQDAGMRSLMPYQNFQARADAIKNQLLSFLIEQKNKKKVVVAYGAAAKGNTLLNYAGIKPDLVPVVFDAAKSKQGQYLPGSHIPILAPEQLKDMSPDVVLILPWNIADEVITQNSVLVPFNTEWVVAIPELQVYE